MRFLVYDYWLIGNAPVLTVFMIMPKNSKLFHFLGLDSNLFRVSSVVFCMDAFPAKDPSSKHNPIRPSTHSWFYLMYREGSPPRGLSWRSSFCRAIDGNPP